MLKHIDTTEQVCKGWTPFQNNHGADDNCTSYGGGRGGCALLSNPDKGRTIARKRNHVGLPSNDLTGDKRATTKIR